MPDTTFEEAKRCPKCGNPGKPNGSRDIEAGAKVHSFLCETESCRWYNTGWAVQVNRDGSIPVNDGRQGPKQFELPSWLETVARREIEEAAYLGGFDRDPADPSYGKPPDADEIRRQF